MRLTREEALKRAEQFWQGVFFPSKMPGGNPPEIADLLLAVQAETAQKCCEIAREYDPADIEGSIRAAFPGEEAK